MKVRITNDYSNGHHSEHTVEIETEPSLEQLKQDHDDEDSWWQEVVFDETGDGTGLDSSLGFCYTATIIEANNPALVGQSEEWIG
jgi:hypothetical protein